MLDGAMGTMIQQLKLDEAGYRGERFKDWIKDIRGNNDLLILTAARRHPRHPSAIFPRRRRYLREQHLFVHLDRPSRLRHGGAGL